MLNTDRYATEPKEQATTIEKFQHTLLRTVDHKFDMKYSSVIYIHIFILYDYKTTLFVHTTILNLANHSNHLGKRTLLAPAVLRGHLQNFHPESVALRHC